MESKEDEYEVDNVDRRGSMYLNTTLYKAHYHFLYDDDDDGENFK